MKIHQLEVINFRGFEYQIFHFPEQFTVLIGDNDTGKTAILDALAIGAGCIFFRFDHFKSLQRSISDDDVRRVRYEVGQTPTIEHQYPASIFCIGVVDGSEMTWERSLQIVDGKNGSFKSESLDSPNIWLLILHIEPLF